MKNLLTKFTLIIFASVLSHSATAQVLPKKGNPPQRIRFSWQRLVSGEGKAAAFQLQSGDSVVVE